jgi:predicted glycogen debranching enzyme
VSYVRAAVRIGERDWIIDDEDDRQLSGPSAAAIESFTLEEGLPVWIYRLDGIRVEKRVLMRHGSNVTVVRYRLLDAPASPCQLTLMPLLQVRPHDSQAAFIDRDDVHLEHRDNVWQMSFGTVVPPVQWAIKGDGVHGDFASPRHSTLEYALERERGYAPSGVLWCPGLLTMPIALDHALDLVLSTDGIPAVADLDTEDLYRGERQRRQSLAGRVMNADVPLMRELALAADTFLIAPAGRQHDLAEAARHGELSRTIVAGYHWFTDWGRDSMISLEGLALCTGRSDEAAAILQVFAHHVRDGLIPNLFPEGEQEGLYHTADATLWFVNAIDRYAHYTDDRRLVTELLPAVESVIEHHLRGTHFGIGVDAADGLLSQGAEHYQLTWMDAKVGDWVVTPRRGKAVEINALWYNALRIVERWQRERGRENAADRCARAADRAYESFNRRFWNTRRHCLFDVVDGETGDDDACRPNQVLAISLPHPVLAAERWKPVLGVVRDALLTPVGLRSLAADHPSYQRKYFGDLRTRDAAYHQGTVWAWLVGPFVDAWLRTYPDDAEGAARALDGFRAHLDQACVGSVSEIFDAESPFTPRGCVAQAWSVAEVLRASLRVESARNNPDRVGYATIRTASPSSAASR